MYSLTCNKSHTEEDTTFGDISCNKMKVMLSFPNSKWQLAVILDFAFTEYIAILYRSYSEANSSNFVILAVIE